MNRRDFLHKTAAAALAAGSALRAAPAMAQPRGERPTEAGDVTTLQGRLRCKAGGEYATQPGEEPECSIHGTAAKIRYGPPLEYWGSLPGAILLGSALLLFAAGAGWWRVK